MSKKWGLFRRAVWIVFGSWWIAALLLWAADVKFFSNAGTGMFGYSGDRWSSSFDFTGYKGAVTEAFWVYLLPFIVFCFIKIAVPLIAGKPKEIFSIWVRKMWMGMMGV